MIIKGILHCFFFFHIKQDTNIEATKLYLNRENVEVFGRFSVWILVNELG